MERNMDENTDENDKNRVLEWARWTAALVVKEAKRGDDERSADVEVWALTAWRFLR